MLCAYVIFVWIPSHAAAFTAPAGAAAALGRDNALLAGFVCLGLTASWCRSGVNQPLLAEVVPSQMRATVMATEV
jgi:hypothetical protein